MERTSPTRSGATARHRSAKIEFHVFNLNERGSHGEDYSGRTGFGKADNPSARDRRGGSGGAAQGGAAGATVGAAGAISALRSVNGSMFGRASLGARVDSAGARHTDHGGRVRAAVSQESGGEERRQRCRGRVYGDAATEHALRDGQERRAAGATVLAPRT